MPCVREPLLPNANSSSVVERLTVPVQEVSPERLPVLHPGTTRRGPGVWELVLGKSQV